jgi:hypothetical protein
VNPQQHIIDEWPAIPSEVMQVPLGTPPVGKCSISGARVFALAETGGKLQPALVSLDSGTPVVRLSTGEKGYLLRVIRNRGDIPRYGKVTVVTEEVIAFPTDEDDVKLYGKWNPDDWKVSGENDDVSRSHSQKPKSTAPKTPRGEQLSEKTIYIEFLGGDMDGRTIDTATATPAENLLIRMIYNMSHGGQIGQGSYGVSMSHIEKTTEAGKYVPPSMQKRMAHQYIVAEREETESEVLLRVRYSVRTFGEKDTE